jgi:hypothetical protein
VPPYEKVECWADIRTLIKPLPGIRAVLDVSQLLFPKSNTENQWFPNIKYPEADELL